MNFYITFGQRHIHKINNKTFDSNCIALIVASNMTEARERAFKLFSKKWFTSYKEEEKKHDTEFMSYFPRGVIRVE